MIIGNKHTFAFEIATPTKNELQTVNIIIENNSVCCDDNSVHVPQFINSLNSSLVKLKETIFTKYASYFHEKTCEEIHRFIQSTKNEDLANFDIENNEIYPTHQFMDWGPTTDNLSCFIFKNNGKMLLSYEFWQKEHHHKNEVGIVNCVEIDKQELIITISVAELEKQI